MKIKGDKSNVKRRITLCCLDQCMCRGLKLWNSQGSEAVKGSPPPPPPRICTCCVIIYILLCMIYFMGSPLCALPSVAFDPVDFIVERHSGLHFYSVVLNWAAIVSMPHGCSSQIGSIAEAWLLDVTLKLFHVNLFVFPMRSCLHDCSWRLGIQLANYQCVIGAGNWLIHFVIITQPSNANIERVSIFVGWYIYMLWLSKFK